MAFPSIRSSIVTNGTTASATPVVNLPATISAGDTIIVWFKNATAGAIGWPANWNELVDASPDASVGQIGLAWKKADGTEGGTTISLTSGNGKFAAIAWAIQDAHDPTVRPPQISTVAVGTTGEPNSTVVTPTGGAKDYLFGALYAMEGEQTGVTSYPASYTLGQHFANSGTAGAVTTNCTLGGAWRQLNAASDDAGVWDVTGTLDDSSAYGIAVHPIQASPSVSPSASKSPSASVSPSASPSPSVSPSASKSPSASESPSVSPSASQSASVSPSASKSPSASISPSVSPSSSASPSISVSTETNIHNYRFVKVGNGMSTSEKIK